MVGNTTTNTWSRNPVTAQPNTVNFKNTRKSATVTVTKVMSNGTEVDNAKDFSFEASLGGTLSNYTGNGFNEGKQSFTLRNGQDAKSLTVPVGASLTITETIDSADNWKYTTSASSTGSSGSFSDLSYQITSVPDTGDAVTFTNTRKTQTVTITKKLVDPVVNSAEFNFAGTLKDGDTDITGSITNLSSFTIVANEKVSGQENTYIGTATFTLPVGTVLTVSENMTDEQSNMYESDVDRENGSLTVSETVANNTLTFTNTRKSARLTITKNVTGAMGDRSAANQFTFTLVSVADEVAGTTYVWTKTAADNTTTSGTLTTTAGSNTFTLAHGENIVIDFPLNKAVEIEETNGEYTPSWSTTDSDANLITGNGEPAKVTITLKDDADVTITNDRPALAPTGLHFDYRPFLLLLGAGVLIVLARTLGRKRRKDDE